MRKVQVGNRVQPGDPLMTLVPLEHLWVEAKLRETEMERVRPGQRAEITVDLYGESHIYHGTVEGLVPGTGSVFALLPRTTQPEILFISWNAFLCVSPCGKTRY